MKFNVACTSIVYVLVNEFTVYVITSINKNIKM